MNIKPTTLMVALLVNVAFLQPAIATEKRASTSPNSNIAGVESITKSQAQAAKMFLVVENFEKIDANSDGRVTRYELRQYALSTRRHIPMT